MGHPGGMSSPEERPSAVILDVDGTLADSSYHQVLAWSRAFQAHDVHVPLHLLHAHMGMGGDRLVEAVAGAEVERRIGDAVRERWRTAYGDLLGEVRPFEGVHELLAGIEERGLRVAIASSGDPGHLERTLEILDIGDDCPVADSGAAGETKPHPDLVVAAMELVDAHSALVVGDTVWDMEAAGRAGQPAVAVEGGGIAPDRLMDAGARHVYPRLLDLAQHLDEALAG